VETWCSGNVPVLCVEGKAINSGEFLKCDNSPNSSGYMVSLPEPQQVLYL